MTSWIMLLGFSLALILLSFSNKQHFDTTVDRLSPFSVATISMRFYRPNNRSRIFRFFTSGLQFSKVDGGNKLYGELDGGVVGGVCGGVSGNCGLFWRVNKSSRFIESIWLIIWVKLASFSRSALPGSFLLKQAIKMANVVPTNTWILDFPPLKI